MTNKEAREILEKTVGHLLNIEWVDKNLENIYLDFNHCTGDRFTEMEPSLQRALFNFFVIGMVNAFDTDSNFHKGLDDEQI